MSEAYMGEVRLFAFSFPPKGWAACDGQIMAISQNQALFSLLGTTYGGNGQTTFALPDLRGRVPLHFGNGFAEGQVGGEEAHRLISTELPAHTHAVQASTSDPSTPSPAGAVWANRPDSPYSPSGDVYLNQAAIASTGGSQSHPNMQPYLTVNYCIALVGIYPSRN